LKVRKEGRLNEKTLLYGEACGDQTASGACAAMVAGRDHTMWLRHIAIHEAAIAPY